MVELLNLSEAICERLLAEVLPGEAAHFDFEQLGEIVNNSGDPLMVHIAMLRNGVFPRATETGAVKWSTAARGADCGREIHFDSIWWNGERFLPDEDDDED